MATSLAELLQTHRVLLADGSTGTNYMDRGLGPGDPPEVWNVEHPDRVRGLHQEFVDAGADIILTNSFGGTANRLALHEAGSRVHELNSAAARLARDVADGASRPVVVAGAVGPLGELFEPLGALTHGSAVASFREQIQGLYDGGADLVWIETMSAAEEVRAAAEAAIAVGLPYTATLSFDTAGRTMMGIRPGQIAAIFDELAAPPVASGANCGVGASDILVALLAMSAADADKVYISKGNCGIPQFDGADIVYSGSTEVMDKYAALAVAAGARIVGGCCGTTPAHLAAMRRSIDSTGGIDSTAAHRPTIDDIIAGVGPLINPVATTSR